MVDHLISPAYTDTRPRPGFYINLPIGAAAAALLLLIHIPDHRGDASSSSRPSVMSALRKLDLVGFVFFAGFAIMIELALEWGGSDYAWDSAVVIGLFCGGVVAFTVFIYWELHVGDSAMIPPKVMRKRQVWTSALFLGFFSGAMLCFSYYVPIYFQAVKGVSALLSGVYMLAGIGPQIVMAITSGVISEFAPPYYYLSSGQTISLDEGEGLCLHVHASDPEYCY